MMGTPVVSIGMYVCNEERFLEEALESLLRQDFREFELLISDNASTDRTEAICRRFASLDDRVRYHRHPVNVGARENFNWLVRQCRSDYFLPAAGHDLWGPQFLSHCLRPLLHDETVVLSYPRAMLIDSEGRELGVMPGGVDTRSLGRLRRFQAVLWWLPNGNPFYGLMRTAALRRADLSRKTISPDIVLLGELALSGAFAHVPEVLWYRREIRAAESAVELMRRQIAVLDSNSPRPGIVRAYLRLVRTHFLSLQPVSKNPFLTAALVSIVLARYGFFVPYRWFWKGQRPVRTEKPPGAL